MTAIGFASTAAHAGSPPTYTVTDLGTLPGYEDTFIDTNTQQALNNAGQAIVLCNHIIDIGDPTQNRPSLSVVTAARYTPGVGLEPLGSSFTQNRCYAHYINDHGQVYGKAYQVDTTFGPPPFYQTIITTSQQTLWLYSNGTGAQVLDVPSQIVASELTLTSNKMLNNSGIPLILALYRPSPGVFIEDAGIYTAGGWMNLRDLGPELVSAPEISGAAIADSGDIIGTTFSPEDFTQGFWYHNGTVFRFPGPGYFIPRSIRDNGSLVAGEYNVGTGAQVAVATPGQPVQIIHDSQYGEESYAGNMAGPYVSGMYFSSDSAGTVFRWDSRTGTTEVLEPDVFDVSVGMFGMNANGHIIGNTRTDLGFLSPWVWIPGVGKVLLQDAIGDPFAEEWELSLPTDINDPGQILVKARRISDGHLRVLILTPDSSSSCAADFNGVNGVTVQDIFDFLTAWLAGSPSANFNHVNGVTVQDIFDFLTAWLAGC